MRFLNFNIENFRGIERLQLDLAKSPTQKVITLVGLNESGKTTILEAINHFSANPESLDALDQQGYKIENQHSLIPISKQSNFNGETIIKVEVELDEEDWKAIESSLKKIGGLQLSRVGDKLVVTQRIAFENSRYIQDKSTVNWTWPFEVKTKTAQAWRQLRGEESKRLADSLVKRFPSIRYFPNFLFEFPKRIYIEQAPAGEDAELHQFYARIVQDILDSLDNDTDVTTHIVERIKSANADDKKALKRLLLQMGSHVTKRVFDSWSRILGKNAGNKKVVIDYGRETPDSPIFLEFIIEEGDLPYSVGQRSLGFRWFFVFLLLTEYRGFRKSGNRNLLFLFDEPASNLHATAQGQLLHSFKKLSETCHIIYTTHSHYLINPEWLEGTFVVRNEGMDYEADVDDFTQSNTKITAMPYREFVSKYPDQTTYYKPILDVLDWAPSRLEFVPNAVFVEGKNDFYTLNFLRECLGSKTELRFLPTGGAGSKEPLISLYVGWGRPFSVLLDADNEGRKQKERYKEMFGDWIEARIHTLADIEENWIGRELEDVLTENDRKRILIAAGESGEYSKKRFNRCVQELLAAGKRVELTKQGEANARKLLEALEKFTKD